MSAQLIYPAVVSSLIRKPAQGYCEEETRANQLSCFFELSSDLFCIAGLDGYFKVLNRAWEATLGFSREELLARPWIEFVHPEDRDSTIAEAQRAAAQGRTFSFENQFRCKDGSYRWLFWNATVMPEQKAIYAAARDITDRAQSETELRQVHRELETRVEERTAELAKANAILLAEITHCRRMEGSLWEANKKYQSIFENAVEGIFQSTPDGTYLSVNPALARIKGYSSPEELMTSVEDIGQQSYVDRDRRREFKSLMEKYGVVNGFEYQVYRKDGKKIWLSMNARAVRNAEGTVHYYEGTIEDITERKQLERQLRHAQKMEAAGQLAGGIAHDFNNLLGVIIGHGDLLLQNLQEGHPLRNHVEQINRASESAASLVAQLLAFSRQQVVQPVVLDLNTVVRNVSKMLASVIGENVSLTTLLDGRLGFVKADRGQMEQALINLIMNGRDAMPNGGRLTIATANVRAEDGSSLPFGQAVSGPAVMLSVTDTGIGMDAETQSHIFEPFFTTKERGKGNGLGLASVYGAVKQNGGSIGVQSEISKGTTFRILLPCVDEPAEEIHALHCPEPASQGSETVLIVEDDASLRELIRGLLTDCGYTVFEAANGSQALSIVQHFGGNINLLLSDVVMPGLSGPQIADKLTSLHPHMRVLYMSGHAAFGGDHHIRGQEKWLLQKPFTQNDLFRKIREALAT